MVIIITSSLLYCAISSPRFNSKVIFDINKGNTTNTWWSEMVCMKSVTVTLKTIRAIVVVIVIVIVVGHHHFAQPSPCYRGPLRSFTFALLLLSLGLPPSIILETPVNMARPWVSTAIILNPEHNLKMGFESSTLARERANDGCRT